MAVDKELCESVSNFMWRQLYTHQDTGDDRYHAEQNMIIKFIERKTAGLPSRQASIDTNECQVLNPGALLAEAGPPHIFEDSRGDEEIT